MAEEKWSGGCHSMYGMLRVPALSGISLRGGGGETLNMLSLRKAGDSVSVRGGGSPSTCCH